MERFRITRLISTFMDLDGTSRSSNQTEANQPPTIPPTGTLPSVTEFTNDVGDHTIQENPLRAVVHSLPDSISADERAEIDQLLDKMRECVIESQRGYHDHSNSTTSHAPPAPPSQPRSNEAQDGTPLIDPRLPYWYGI